MADATRYRGGVETQHRLVCGCGRSSTFWWPEKPIAIKNAKSEGWHYASDLGFTCPVCWADRKNIREKQRA